MIGKMKQININIVCKKIVFNLIQILNKEKILIIQIVTFPNVSKKL